MNLLYLNHRRILFTMHWVAASAAGCGSCLAFVEWAGMLVDFFDQGFVILSLITAELLAALAMLFLQQLILSRAGWPDTPWLMLTLVGMVVSCTLAGPLLFLVSVVSRPLAFPHKDLLLCHLFFLVLAAIFGLVQSLGLRISSRQLTIWLLTNGLLGCLFMNLGWWHLLADFRWTEVGLLIGLLYGLTTGICLGWMLPATGEIKAELRYFAWLGHRNLPERVNWDFLEKSP